MHVDEDAPFVGIPGGEQIGSAIRLDSPREQPCMWVREDGVRCDSPTSTVFLSVGPHEFAMCECHSKPLLDMLGLSYEGYRKLVGRMEIGMAPWEGELPEPSVVPDYAHNCRSNLYAYEFVRSRADRRRAGRASLPSGEPAAGDGAPPVRGREADPEEPRDAPDRPAATRGRRRRYHAAGTGP